jgi:hypothetical protein
MEASYTNMWRKEKKPHEIRNKRNNMYLLGERDIVSVTTHSSSVNRFEDRG